MNNTEKQEFYKLMHELLDDHARLFDNVFPTQFKRLELHDEEYILDMRIRVIDALNRFLLER